LVALLGGVMGGAMAWWGLQGLAQFAPVALPRDYAHSMNGMVLGYTAAIALLTGILFGLAPALQSSSARLIDSLKQGGRTSSESGGGRRLRGFLMIAEVALSLVLLIGAGLLIRSFLLLVDVKPGFDAAHVLSVQISLPEYAYRDDRARVGFYRRALEKLRALPGVVGAGAIDDLPLTQDRDSSTIAVEGLPPSPPGQAPTVQVRSVTPDYFRAMGIPQLAGRAPSELDTSSAPPVVVVNQTLARRIFPKEDPIGRRLAFGVAGQSPWMTIVGVVGDVHDTSLASQAEMEVYQPYQQSVAPYTNLVLRTPGDPAQLGPTVLRELHGIDKDLPLQTQPMDAVTAASVAQRQFQMLLLSLFALLALVLAAVGIYGVVSYSVAQRINEIGVRMALGARRSDVLKLVVGHSLGRVATGAAFGLLASLILTKLLSAMLYGIGATDPLTLGAVVLLLAAVAALASYVPARRAMKVDPMTALRSE
jgi:predicted permease